MKGRLLFRVVVIALLTWLAVRFINGRELVSQFSGVSWRWLLLMLAIVWVDRLLMAAKWTHLAKGIHLDLPLRETVKAYFGASFLNYTLPTTITGEVFRAYHMKKAGRDTAPVIATMAMEKVVGILSTVFLALAGLSVLMTKWEGPFKLGLAAGLLGGAAAIFLGFAWTLYPSSRIRLEKFFLFLRLKKAAVAVDRIAESYGKFSVAKRCLAVNGGLSLVESIVQMSILFISAAALGIQVDAMVFFAMLTVVTLVRRISIILDSWGLSEALTVGLFSLAGISPAEALAISLLRHAVIAVGSLPGMLMVGGSAGRLFRQEAVNAGH